MIPELLIYCHVNLFLKTYHELSNCCFTNIFSDGSQRDINETISPDHFTLDAILSFKERINFFYKYHTMPLRNDHFIFILGALIIRSKRMNLVRLTGRVYPLTAGGNVNVCKQCWCKWYCTSKNHLKTLKEQVLHGVKHQVHGNSNRDFVSELRGGKGAAVELAVTKTLADQGVDCMPHNENINVHESRRCDFNKLVMTVIILYYDQHISFSCGSSCILYTE